MKQNLSLSVDVNLGTSLKDAVESAEQMLISLPVLSSVDFNFNGVPVVVTRSSAGRHLRANEKDLYTQFSKCMSENSSLIL